ncbi:hypothetical protein ADMFC3_04840 [Geovibrio sp. ADMFC3]
MLEPEKNKQNKQADKGQPEKNSAPHTVIPAAIFDIKNLVLHMLEFITQNLILSRKKK